jgi:uncharacterized protein (DUF952 family)
VLRLSTTRILHIATTGDWEAALAAGHYNVSSRDQTLADEGFIHASTSRQAPGVLERYYADLDPAGLLLLVLDIAALEAAGSAVRWDDVPGQPEPFPHIYGPIIPGAAVAVLPVEGAAGAPELPDLTGLDVAATRP